jgi:hypothetical protein
MNYFKIISFFACLAILCPPIAQSVEPVVLCDETVTEFTPPGNGAGSLWCYGAPLVVRIGDRVFISVMETGVNARLYSNSRWQLFERTTQGWSKVLEENKYQQREPCPIAALSDDQLILSSHPEIRRISDAPDEKSSYCENILLSIPLNKIKSPPDVIHPPWPKDLKFFEHSYRCLSANKQTSEILLCSAMHRKPNQHYMYRNSEGEWAAHGWIHFPVRGCYAQTAIQDKSAHIMAVGDIVEPVQEWWKFKKEQTGRVWDYVFRRLFYTWTPDITKQQFCESIEIDNVDATAGYIQNLDLWLGENQSVYLLYTKRTVQNAMMRDKFFPNMKLTISLECVELRKGKIQRRFTLAQGGEGLETPAPSYARFHATPDGNLYVVASENGANWIQQIHPQQGDKIPIPFKHAFSTFFTATERGGSDKSNYLDMFGYGPKSNTLRYACVQLE